MYSMWTGTDKKTKPVCVNCSFSPVPFTHECVFHADCVVYLGGRKRAAADSSPGVLRAHERRLRYVIYILPGELCVYSHYHTTYVTFKEKSCMQLKKPVGQHGVTLKGKMFQSKRTGLFTGQLSVQLEDCALDANAYSICVITVFFIYSW